MNDELIKALIADNYTVELKERTIAEEGHMLAVSHATQDSLQIMLAVEFISKLIEFNKVIRPINKEAELPNTKVFHIHE